MFKKITKIFILFIIFFTLSFSFVSFAAFDILNQMLNNIKDKEISTNMKILQILYDDFNTEEKDALNSLKMITVALSDADTDELFKYIDNNNTNTVKNNLSNFFNTYDTSKNAISDFFKRAEYKILSVKENKGVVRSKVEISLVDLNKLMTKIAPGFIAKNFMKIMKGKDGIDNDLINSLLESLKKGLNNNNEKTTFEYNIEMKKVDNIYKVSNVNDITKDIENYIKNQISNLSKLNK